MKRLSELFAVRYGDSLELNRLKTTTPENGVPFVSRKMGDNGIAAHVERLPNLKPNPAGELTCALSGNGVLTTFIQDRPYYTAFHVACLNPLVDMTAAQKLYYCVCIRANRYRYGWGRQANRSLKDILLPELPDIPSWVEDAGATDFTGRDAPAMREPVLSLDASAWKPFRLGNLFEIRRGVGLPKHTRQAGDTPYIGALDRNNGLAGRIAQPAMHRAGTLTLNWNGIGGVGVAFYQPTDYWCSGDVSALHPKFNMTAASAMFLIAVIRRERYRFTFGRKLTRDRMVGLAIRLPTLANGTPDWDFMERYIKTLPFSSQL